MTAAELQSDDPQALAARWSEVLDRPVTPNAAGNPQIALDDAVLRFVPATDGRGEGLGGLDVKVVDRDWLLASAAARGFHVADDTVVVCGTRFRLV
jgi:hypothetical protein